MPTVITKKSTVAAKVPLSTDLQVGELAVNTADKKLYSKHSDNSVVEVGFSPTSMTGQLASPTSIQFGDGSAETTSAGKIWYNPTNGAYNAGMGGGNITQQIGEELFVYGKASAAITGQTLLQVIAKTGTVGASGVITFAPAGSGITDVNLIVGVGTEDIALNAFGRVTSYGIVRGIDTSGSTYSETWADNDTIWYKPSTGGLTKTKPTSGILVSIGTVISASSGSGSIQVKVQVYADLTAPGPIGAATPSTVAATSLTVTGGTVTASTPVINVTQTWNNAAVAFTARVTNVTNTASAAASLIEDWKIDGVSKGYLRKDGTFRTGGSYYWELNNDPDFPVINCKINNGNTQYIKNVNGYGWEFYNSATAGYTFIGGKTIGLPVAGGLYWTSSTDPTNGTRVSAIFQDASGVLKVTDGAATNLRDLKLRNLIATGSISSGLSAKTADYTVTANDGTLTADSTSAAITFTLEAASGHNRIHAFVKTAGSNTVTIDGNASETIDGSTSVTLADRMVLQSNGTNWVRIA